MSTIFVFEVLSAFLIYTLIGELSAKTNQPDVQYPFSSKREALTICLQDYCRSLSKNLTAKNDLTLNPCTNFYQFACGKYKKGKTDLDTSKDIILFGTWVLLRRQVRDDDYRALRMAKETYHSCLKHASNVDDMKKLIEEVGGWSLLDPNWSESSFSIQDFYKKAIRNGYMPKSLVVIAVRRHPTDVTKRIVTVEKDKSQEFPDNYDFNGYFVSKIVKKLNLDAKKAKEDFQRYKRVHNAVIAINKKFTHSESEIVPLNELQARYQNMPLVDQIVETFSPTVVIGSSPVYVDYIKHLAALNNLIRDTPSRDLASYLMWTMVLTLGPDVDSELFTEAKLFSTREAEYYCANKVADLFRRVVDHEYVVLLVRKALKKDLMTFADTIRIVANVTINQSSFDDDTKKRIINKFNNVRWKFVYDDAIETSKQVDEYYAGLNTDAASFFPTVLNITKFLRLKTFNVALEKPWTDPYFSITVNEAEYDPFEQNIIYFGEANLNDQFSPYAKPIFWQYATIGYFMGRALFHAVDSTGIKYDENGNFNEKWLNDKAKNKFQNTYDCLLKQYSGMEATGIRVKTDNKRNLKENFCVNGGVDLAYNTYSAALRTKKIKDEILPNYTQFSLRQMFWIVFASIHCEKRPAPEYASALLNNTYISYEVKVNGALMNRKHFADDFKCDLGTPMNPNNKCQTWD